MCGLADPKHTSLEEHSEIKGVDKHYVWIGDLWDKQRRGPESFRRPFRQKSSEPIQRPDLAVDRLFASLLL